jgi:hypothetical protein
MMNGFTGRRHGPGQWRGSPGPYQPGVGMMGAAPAVPPNGGAPMPMPGPMPPPGPMPGAPMIPGGPSVGMRPHLAQAIADWKARRGNPMPMGR